MGFIENKIQEWLPTKPLVHPIKWNGDPNFHLFVCNPGVKGVWERLSFYNLFTTVRDFWIINSFVGSWMLLAAEVLFGINIYGIYSMPYQGFTEYKDRRLCSFTSELKYVLNPNEFVMFDQDVYSMTDGVVKEVYNRYPDRISRVKSINRIGLNTELYELYGNYIVIETGNLEYVYAGIKYNSANHLKIGDTIPAGTRIGKVGCQGLLGSRPFLHLALRLNKSISLKPLPLNDYMLYFPILKFKPFYNYPIITDAKDSAFLFEQTKARDIKYTYNSGTFIYNGTLVRPI